MKRVFRVSLVALFVSHSNLAGAASVESSECTDNHERITVTASRQESLDTELALSVHSVGKGDLEIDNGQHAAESLNSIAGVLVDQLSAGQGHKAAIRMPINVSGYYLYLQDNIPLQSPAFFDHNALWWSSFNSNVARMEVLKGAGTALYGSGAVAATVNVLSNDVAETPETSMNFMLAQHGYHKAQFSHSNKASNTQGFRVSASYLNNEGWQDHTGSQRAEFTLRHEWELANNERLVTSLMVSNLEQEMAVGLSEETFKNDKSHSGLSDTLLNHDPMRQTSYVRLSSHWYKAHGDKYFSLIPYMRHRTSDHVETWNQNLPKVKLETTTIGMLALANFENVNSDTTVGLDVEITDGKQLSFQPVDITTTGWGADTFTEGEKFYDDTTKYTSFSPYLQYKRSLNQNLILTLGARYDYAQYKFDNHLNVIGDIGHGKLSLRDANDYFSHLSPKASLNYQLNSNSSVFLRYANSFRLPTAGSLYHLTTKDDGNAKAVDPEVSDTVEIGYKANWKDITFDTALYYMDVDDGIVHSYNESGQRYLTNASRVTHKGLEVALTWQVNQQFKISSAYSQSTHRFDQHDQYAGNEMAIAPDYIANLRLQYSPAAIPTLTSMLEVQSIGEYWMDDANSQNEQGRDRTYGGYTLVNLKARYSISPELSIHARILNLSDRHYAREARFRYGRASYFPGAPRTFYLGLNYKW